MITKKVQVKNSADTINLELRDEGTGYVNLFDGDRYIGFFGWNDTEGLYFYSSVMYTKSGDCEVRYGLED